MSSELESKHLARGLSPAATTYVHGVPLQEFLNLGSLFGLAELHIGYGVHLVRVGYIEIR